MSKIIRLGKNRTLALTKTRVMDFSTYLGVILAFAIVTALGNGGVSCVVDTVDGKKRACVEGMVMSKLSHCAQGLHHTLCRSLSHA